MLFAKLLLILALFGFVAAHSELPERARGGRAYKEMQAKLGSSLKVKGTEAQTWQAPVDHFNKKSNATFAQRFYVDNQYWDGTGPVFYYISGEGTCNGPPSGYVATLGAQYKALLIALEHRFYGESIPNGNASTENYQFLSVEQALADLAGFTDYYKASIDSRTASTPWVVFGGSYAGAVSSWYRAAYPEHSVGSLSSSGVMNCIIDFYQFDMQVSASAGNDCTNKIKQVQAAFARHAGTSEKGLQSALSKFNCEKDMALTDFYYMIADSWSMGIQYGAKTAMCSTLATITPSSTDEEVMQTFADWSNEYWGSDFCAGGFYNTKQIADPARWEINSRSWRYQTCAQVSYFNTAPKSGSLRSETVNLSYHLKQCEAMFGKKMFPASDKQNAIYGADFPHAHNVFYSDFSDDPWQRASVWFSPSADQPYHLANCDNCGHCLDLHQPLETDPAPLKESRAEFEKYLAQWLTKK